MRRLMLTQAGMIVFGLLSIGWSTNGLSQSNCSPESHRKIVQLRQEVLQLTIGMAQGRVHPNEYMQRMQQLQPEAMRLQEQCPGAFGSARGGTPYGGSSRGYEGGNILRGDGGTLFAPSEGLGCDSRDCYAP